MGRYLSGPFLFFCFFPYLTPVATNTDLQPYALLLSLVVCIIYRWRLPLALWLLGVPTLVALLLWMMDLSSFFAFRSFAGYLSLWTIAIATYVLLRQSDKVDRMLRSFVAFATWIWLVAGLIETFINPSLFASFIPNISLDVDRGVTGLATEPSFYAIYCIFLIGLNLLCRGNDRLIIALLLFQIVFLAKSAIGVVMLAILFAYWGVIFVSPHRLAVVALTAVAGALITKYVLPQFLDLRLASLVIDIWENPALVLQVDTSVNARVGHMLFSVYGFVDNLGLPHGFDHFHHYVADKLSDGDYVWLGVNEPGLKIMSGYGSALFELGVFGMFVPLAVTLMIFSHFRGRGRTAAVVNLYVHTIMFAAIQLSLPLLGVCLGYMAFRTGSQNCATSNLVKIAGEQE